MSGVPVGHTAIGLAWLPPPALLALAAEPPDAATLLRDPAAVAHVLRFARPMPDPCGPVFVPQVLTQPGLCEAAASLLNAFPPRTQGSVPELVTRVTTLSAGIAAELALREGSVSPDAASGVTRLAGIGWYAVAAVDPTTCSTCLDDPTHEQNPETVQRRAWGLDASSIARRLAARWRLPSAVVAVIGGLKLNTTDAVSLGAPAALFRVVQAAVHAAESELGRIGLADPRLASSDLARDARAIAARLQDALTPEPTFPLLSDTGLVVCLLRATARARRATGAVWLAEAEATIDRMTIALADWRAEFQDRLLAAKLESLAEFAAGASHEINNPLAVISGHAQLMLAGETDPERQRQLSVIVRQTRRVHELLQGTLLYARPPRPEPTVLALASLVAEVAAAFQPDAATKAVSLSVTPEQWDGATTLAGDQSQLRQAIGHLVRNAVEAASEGGWVRVSVEADDGQVRVIVSDSGPGPAAKHVPHLFDPFFSGRSAGRGRGLGLSIAWRLARVNGGDLRYDPNTDGTTRFVLSLPRASQTPLTTLPERKIA